MGAFLASSAVAVWRISVFHVRLVSGGRFLLSKVRNINALPSRARWRKLASSARMLACFGL